MAEPCVGSQEGRHSAGCLPHAQRGSTGGCRPDGGARCSPPSSLWTCCAVLQSVQRQHLQRCKLVGQWDRKFLIFAADGLLFVMDQHAADERVRLERLQRQVCLASELLSQLASGRA